MAGAALFAFLLAVASTCAWAESAEQNVYPEINIRFQHPDYNEWLARFERPGREVYDRRLDILEALDLRPGMAVADIGAGTGLYTMLFAERVAPGGRVYAVDIARMFVDNIKARARSLNLENIRGIVNSQREANLPENSIDLAFVCATYHHFEYPRKMLASIRRALRPGGVMVVIDFRKAKGISSDWVMKHVRTGKVEVIREIEAGGFRLVEDRDFLRKNYFLRFENPADCTRLSTRFPLSSGYIPHCRAEFIRPTTGGRINSTLQIFRQEGI